MVFLNKKRSELSMKGSASLRKQVEMLSVPKLFAVFILTNASPIICTSIALKWNFADQKSVYSDKDRCGGFFHFFNSHFCIFTLIFFLLLLSTFICFFFIIFPHYKAFLHLDILCPIRYFFLSIYHALLLLIGPDSISNASVNMFAMFLSSTAIHLHFNCPEVELHPLLVNLIITCKKGGDLENE